MGFPGPRPHCSPQPTWQVQDSIVFIDEAEILVKAGDGGDGCVSFRREKYVPRGGPDGGDGGKGGDAVAVADGRLVTLADFAHRPSYRAESGDRGRGKRRAGRSGADLELRLPVGTLIRLGDRTLADLARPGQRFLLARGGGGGRGNAQFATSVRQAPRFAEKGVPGEERRLRLELKLLADVGVIGLPNVGKSTLISRVSSARPKIADYPFTTLVPNLGVVRIDEGTSYVIADMPGLIEGAHRGRGRGHAFLRHIERARVLIHLLDLSAGREPLRDLDLLNRELSLYNPRLAELPQLIGGNKIDLPEGQEALAAWAEALRGRGEFFPISAVTGEGVRELTGRAAALLAEIAAPEEASAEAAPPFLEEAPSPLRVEVVEPGLFRATGDQVERLIARTDLANEEAMEHLRRNLSRLGLFRALHRRGARPGDKVMIGKAKLDFTQAGEEWQPVLRPKTKS